MWEAHKPINPTKKIVERDLNYIWNHRTSEEVVLDSSTHSYNHHSTPAYLPNQRLTESHYFQFMRRTSSLAPVKPSQIQTVWSKLEKGKNEISIIEHRICEGVIEQAAMKILNLIKLKTNNRKRIFVVLWIAIKPFQKCVKTQFKTISSEDDLF